MLGSTNGCVLAFPRSYYAMSRDGLFFKQLATIHPKFGTPVTSLIISAVLSIVLILSGTFSQLTTLVIFTGMVFSTMVIAGLFILRRKQPNLKRPYKVWGYPLVPILVLMINVALLLNTLINDFKSSLLGLVVPVLGIPVYLWFQRKSECVTNVEFKIAD
nr:amino acid permease [Clostridium sp. 'deep sea']